jgi:transposase
VIDPSTGEIRQAQLFVAVFGASNYTYAEATWTQSLPDWLGSHVRALEFFGGAPEMVVPDNLRSGVKRHLVGAGLQLVVCLGNAYGFHS